MGNISSPTRRGASESAAIPPASASTGLPAASASVSVGAASGSTPITLGVPAHHAAMPPISPPPPTETSSVSRSGACRDELERERALAQQRLRLIEGVYRQRARLRRPGLAGRERVGIAVAADDQVGAVAPDALHLRGRGHGGHEDAGGHAEPHGGVRDGGAVIAARGGHHARRRDRAREQVGERAPRLERARVLEQLELQGQRELGEAEVGAIQLHDGRHADVGLDQGMRLLDRGPVYRGRHRPS